MLSRAEQPSSYASPLARILDGETIDHLLPPVISGRGNYRLIRTQHKSWAEITNPHLHGVRFLGEQLYSDLVRQLISRSGDFEYDHPWIPPEIALDVKAAAHALFFRFFGVTVEEVAVH
jgi:hypothetical protein